MVLRLFAPTSLLVLLSCADRSPADTPVAPPVAAAPAPPPLDAAKVLAIVGEHAPSVHVSVQSRGVDVGLELRSDGEPATALALLASLAERLPGTRVARIQLDAREWTATLSTAAGTVDDDTALARVIAVARPVFAGDAALLQVGIIEPSPGRVAFRGQALPGHTVADAAAVVPAGFTIAKVDSGPPFVFELAKIP